MDVKSEYLQIRVSSEQKTALKRAARRAGLGMSAFVLARSLPRAQARFEKLIGSLETEPTKRAYALAELNDLLTELSPSEFGDAVANAPLSRLAPYSRNYVAAMIEQAAHQKGIEPPAWVAEVEPLEEPHFATPLEGLRLHLLSAAPVPFRRRNIFIDSSIGDRV